MERPDYEFGIAVEVATESIRVCHPSLDVTLQRPDEVSFDCRGKTLESIVYMLFTALDNALEHCGFNDHAPTLSLETSLKDSWLELRLVNSCAPIVSVEEENERLDELRERLENGDEAQGLATIEGGSGYAKIIRILRHDLLTRHAPDVWLSQRDGICSHDRNGCEGDGEMTALIIEDDELKTERLKSFLGQELPDHQIEVARSYKSGLRALVANTPALVILDMTLPTFDIAPGSDGGRPLNLGGRELLRQMKRRSLAYPTVVVTGFDAFGSEPQDVTLAQLDGELEAEFGDFYIGSVYFNATSDDWRDQLRLLVEADPRIS
ncbi:response regulator [Sphingomonas cavernae]|nr:response regulator [Sphingomonas cavernae]